MINENRSPNYIATHLFNKRLTYTTVKNKAIQHYKQHWIASLKKYEYQDNQLPGQVRLFKNHHSIELKDNKKENNDTSQNTSTDSNNSSQILNYLQTIDKNLHCINTRLTQIENYIEKNSPQAKTDFSEAFIEIFASNKERESVNINSKLKKRIIEKMAKSRNITHNQSLAINTALLIALYGDE
ncbi:hypothetical protein [Inediibacterium massiliense]|uniref:hypothetical protein n=1 Tax=Inediibacterium massiliense TaxID=1658111 RepID=UPI0006B45434|nr:hypothetical protein [Inediibacterium massiliense]